MFVAKQKPSVADLRKFALAMLAGFGVLGGALWLATAWRGSGGWVTWNGTRGQWTALLLWLLGVALAGSSQLPYAFARRVFEFWMVGSEWLGRIFSTVLLTVLFFVLLPPFSLIVRRKDPLRKRLTPGKSYWEPATPHEPTLERMRRMF